MFVAGRMFESPQEAKAWVEDNMKPDERRHWVVLELEGDASPPQFADVEGLNPDGSIEGSVIPSKKP